MSFARTRLPIKHTAMSNMITTTNVINISPILHLPPVLDIQEKEVRLGESQDVFYTREYLSSFLVLCTSVDFCAIRHSHRRFCQAYSRAIGLHCGYIIAYMPGNIIMLCLYKVKITITFSLSCEGVFLCKGIKYGYSKNIFCSNK